MLYRKIIDMYSRVKRNRQRTQWMKFGILAVVTVVLGFVATVNKASFLTLSEIRESESKIDVKPISLDFPLKDTKVLAEEKVVKKLDVVSEAKIEQTAVTPATDTEQAAVVVETVAYVPAASPQVTPVSYNNTNTSHPTVLANGNTAGVIGSEAAAQMAAATGVPQATWEYIIARESNGDPYAANASGASGLFQTMPGWGSTATVQDQVNAALNAYNNQGLAAWGM